MDISKIIEDYKARTHVNKEGDYYYLIMPFFHKESSDSIRLRFFEENGELYISDCGDTAEYLDIMYIDIEEYRDTIEKIKERFELTEGKYHEFIMHFPSDQVISIEMYLGYFIQALSLIANVDINK